MLYFDLEIYMSLMLMNIVVMIKKMREYCCDNYEDERMLLLLLPCLRV